MWKIKNKSSSLTTFRSYANEKSFASEMCSKRNSPKSNLIQNQCIHSLEKLFTCDSYNKDIFEKSSLDTQLNIQSKKYPFIVRYAKKYFPNGHI